MNPWKSGYKKNGEIISPTNKSWIGRKYGTKSKQKRIWIRVGNMA
jgi:hypothetical protein